MQSGAIRMGMTVQATDGAAGKIDDILVYKEGGQLHALVVQGRGFFSNDVIVPAEAVTNIDGERVYLRLTRKEVGALPIYRAALHGPAQGLTSQAAVGYDRHDQDRR